MKPVTRWTLALAATLLLAHAAAQQPVAQQPVDGTEVVVTDAAGHQLVGYGVVKNGLLLLRMGSSAESFVVVLLAPDGSVQSYQGIQGAGGALIVDLPDGTRERFSSLLSKNDVALRVVHQEKGSHPARATSNEGSSGGTTASGGSSSGSSGSGISVDTGDNSSSSSSSSDGSSSDGSSSGSTDGP